MSRRMPPQPGLTRPRHQNHLRACMSMPNAAFMAKSLGFDVVDLLTTDFSHAGYNIHTMKNKEVMIQSKDSAVLVKLKQLKTQHKLVYTLPSTVGDATASSIEDIKKFADAAIVDRQSVFVESNGFILRQTNLVKDLQSTGLAVYAQVFRNETNPKAWFQVFPVQPPGGAGFLY
uniref:glycerophosphodiester phosphodiesterase n=1 Tax=Leersia perrieri TaxID=77586 RepID=A0A0D9X9H4_9ORYZ